MRRLSIHRDRKLLSFLLCLLSLLALDVVKEKDSVVVFQYSASAFITPMDSINRHRQAYYPSSHRNIHIGIRTSGATRIISKLRSKPEQSNGDDDNENFDVEIARKQLETLVFGDDMDEVSAGRKVQETKPLRDDYSLIEALMPTISLDYHPDKKYDDDSDKIEPTSTIELPSPPPLSTIERDRRLAEIHLLEALHYGDDATDDLWELWYSERGKTAKSQLERADQLMASPSTYQESEDILKELINTHGVYFVEPLNRLATLWYMQGKNEDSYKLCRMIYQIKPYHFGMLSGIVACCIALRDRSGARKWAEKRLPNCAASTSFPPFVPDESVKNPRRTEWVNNAVQEAKNRLQQSENETKRGLGKPENYYFTPPSSAMNVEEDDDNTQNGLDNIDDDDAWN